MNSIVQDFRHMPTDIAIGNCADYPLQLIDYNQETTDSAGLGISL
jgi:hypothetical protein